MKKAVLAASIVIMALVATAGFSLKGRRMRANNIQVNVKALPEYGLTIVSPSDPSFNEEVSALLPLKDEREELISYIETAKPFCVFVNNADSRRVVGCNLKWELTKENGEVAAMSISYSSPGVFMGMRQPEDELLANGGYIIGSNLTRFFSLEGLLTDLVYGELARRNSSLPALNDKSKQVIRERTVSLNTQYKDLLQSVVSMTVSIDGAFFEDGTFVGPDTNGFFAQTQGQVDARRDLAKLVENDVKTNRTSADIFSKIEQVAKELDGPIGSDAVLRELKMPLRSNAITNENYNRTYEHSLSLFTKELLRMSAAGRDAEAIGYIQQSLRKGLPTLHKINPTK